MLARPVLETSDKESKKDSSSDSSSTEDEGFLENNSTKAIHSESNFLASDSKDDDWLGVKYLQKRLEINSKNNLRVKRDLRSKRDTQSATEEDSEDSSVDFDDGEQIFYTASSE
ncbi:uncharacterized protein LOC136089455 [Hydra vulgaris]|uniref:Uncharacterized protein LOC136089455 n=1 Tax=Hydra vulgaris TaxID=6087 RepID=A0ABM4DAZ6_HYDVU